jgi:hypothetical protein
MEYNTIITFASISLCILLLLRSLFIKKTAKTQTVAIATLQKELQSMKESELREQNFQNSLKHAEVSTELQKTRSVYSNKKGKLRAPERYGYAQAMFQSGMATDKIASALGMSGNEITQLVKLSNLGVSQN